MGADALEEVRASIGDLRAAEFGVLVDLYLSYRAVEAWDEMLALVRVMPEPLARSVMVREQLGLALNRMHRGKEAEEVLLGVIDERGASSETYGILGRVYKDRWTESSDPLEAEGHLKRAIDAYLKGFEADWRDAYPGVNAVTLMELIDPPDPRREELLPVVRYASTRRVLAGSPDYWDHATLLELAVLAGDDAAATAHVGDALAVAEEGWQKQTTANNLALIRKARSERGEDLALLDRIIDSLAKPSPAS